MPYKDILLILLLACAVYTDIRSRIICNSVIAIGTGAALFGNSLLLGLPEGIYFSVKGFLLGAVFLLVPYLLKGMGAGDVKLLGMVGAYKGTLFVLYAFICCALAGGVISLLVLAYKGTKWKKIKDNILAEGIPYALPIGLGTIFTYWVI